MTNVFYLFAFVCGALVAIQASTNVVLLSSVGEVLWVAAALFLVGVIYLAIAITVVGAPIPQAGAFLKAPAWSYIGGVVVATYVVTVTFLVPRIGVTNTIVIVVSGQIVASVLIDHFGCFSVPVKEINFEKLLGVMLLVIGVYFSKK